MCSGGFLGKILGNNNSTPAPSVVETPAPAPTPTVQDTNDTTGDRATAQQQRRKRGFSSTRTTDTLLSDATSNGSNKLG